MPINVFASLALCAYAAWQLLTFQQRVESNMRFLAKTFGEGPNDRHLSEIATLCTVALAASAAFICSQLRY